MKATLLRSISRILVVCIAALPLQAGAGLIGSERAAPAERQEVTRQLQSRGLSHEEAKARVAALTDAEATYLAQNIHELPAGAGGTALGILLVLAFLIWRFNFSDQAKAESAAAKPAAKPAAK
jgi:hypothetical protein